MTISRPVENRALNNIEGIRQVKLKALQEAITTALNNAKFKTPSAKRFEVRVAYNPDELRLVEISEVLGRFDGEHAVEWKTDERNIRITFR